MPLGAIDSDLNWKRGIPTVDRAGHYCSWRRWREELHGLGGAAYARLYR